MTSRSGIQTHLASNRLGRAPVVAGEHHHAQALPVHLRDGCCAALLDRVGHGDQTRPASPSTATAMTVLPSSCSRSISACMPAHVDAAFRHQRRAAQQHGLPVHRRLDAAPGQRVELPARSPSANCSRLGLLDNRLAQRMLAVPLGAGREAQQLGSAGVA